jgi:hypothetical protein
MMWKPTSPWKLWKLQYESHDVDLKARLEEMGWVICKSTFANHPSHLPWILQITSPTSHEFSLGSRSCGLDWTFHSFDGEVGFHQICSQSRKGNSWWQRVWSTPSVPIYKFLEDSNFVPQYKVLKGYDKTKWGWWVDGESVGSVK